MQDPAFKRLFRHPVTIEMLVREHAPERAAKIAGDFKVVEPDWDQSTDRSTDLAAIILALERERSIDATVRMTSRLARVAERTGSAFDRFMADCVREMLISTGRITRAQLKEAETMAQVSTTLEEWGTERFRQGIHQERAAHAAMVCARAGDRFGAEAAEAISALLGDSPDLAQLLAAAGAVFSSETPDELLERVRVLSKG